MCKNELPEERVLPPTISSTAFGVSTLITARLRGIVAVWFSRAAHAEDETRIKNTVPYLSPVWRKQSQLQKSERLLLSKAARIHRFAKSPYGSSPARGALRLVPSP